jgi:hypothetical protein
MNAPTPADIATGAVPIDIAPPDEARRQLVLAELRRLAVGARSTAIELDSIGAALKGDFIDAEQALAELDELGLLHLVCIPLVPSEIDEAWAASAREYAKQRGKRS